MQNCIEVEKESFLGLNNEEFNINNVNAELTAKSAILLCVCFFVRLELFSSGITSVVGGFKFCLR